MKITMLGTGNALVTKCYNTCFVMEEGGRYLMVDGGGGNGVLCRLHEAGFDWMDMRDIFVTHKHLDHLMGIIWMVRMITQHMKEGSYTGEACIYSHEEVISIIREMSMRLLPKKQTDFFDSRLHLITVTDGQETDLLGHKTTFFDIGSTKAKQFGFTMEYREGKKLTCCGDEPYNTCEEKYVQGSTWLMHEAFCLHDHSDIFHPYEKHHSTVKDACEMAEKLQVPNLILYHTEDRNLEDRKRLYTAEGLSVYHGNIYVPDDLEVLNID